MSKHHKRMTEHFIPKYLYIIIKRQKAALWKFPTDFVVIKVHIDKLIDLFPYFNKLAPSTGVFKTMVEQVVNHAIILRYGFCIFRARLAFDLKIRFYLPIIGSIHLICADKFIFDIVREITMRKLPEYNSNKQASSAIDNILQIEAICDQLYNIVPTFKSTDKMFRYYNIKYDEEYSNKLVNVKFHDDSDNHQTNPEYLYDEDAPVYKNMIFGQLDLLGVAHHVFNDRNYYAYCRPKYYSNDIFYFNYLSEKEIAIFMQMKSSGAYRENIIAHSQFIKELLLVNSNLQAVILLSLLKTGGPTLCVIKKRFRVELLALMTRNENFIISSKHRYSPDLSIIRE